MGIREKKTIAVLKARPGASEFELLRHPVLKGEYEGLSDLWDSLDELTEEGKVKEVDNSELTSRYYAILDPPEQIE